jgi:hypothetical protein
MKCGAVEANKTARPYDNTEKASATTASLPSTSRQGIKMLFGSAFVVWLRAVSIVAPAPGDTKLLLYFAGRRYQRFG